MTTVQLPMRTGKGIALASGIRIRRLAEKPRPAFDLAEAYDAHAPALFGFAINALQERPLAEDCLQETFLRAWRARESFDGERGSLRTWLFAILRNVIVDAQRARQRLPRTVTTEILEEEPAEAPDPLERLGLSEALAKLSEEHRRVVVDVHIRGLSYDDVAAATGTPIATLRSRAFYALRALRRHLDEMET